MNLGGCRIQGRQKSIIKAVCINTECPCALHDAMMASLMLCTAPITVGGPQVIQQDVMSKGLWGRFFDYDF